jgi:hypothetical protein
VACCTFWHLADENSGGGNGSDSDSDGRDCSDSDSDDGGKEEKRKRKGRSSDRDARKKRREEKAAKEAAWARTFKENHFLNKGIQRLREELRECQQRLQARQELFRVKSSPI